MQTQSIVNIDSTVESLHAETSLKQQAEKAFPLVDYVPQSSVIHARDGWIKAKQYLADKGIGVKPLINIKEGVSYH